MTGYVTHADLGGTTGYGPIVHEPEGVVFHHDWEARTLALSIAAGAPGGWNIDMSRSARETLPDYPDLTYYEIWLGGLERLLVEHGLVTEAELADGRAATPGDGERRPLPADRVATAMRRGRPTAREPNGPARFAVGDRVRTRPGHVDHHTRLPRYAAGRVGTVELIHGVHVFPDTHARGLGEHPEWLYTVVFETTRLWDDAQPGQRVSIDAWESYLTAADAGDER